MNRIAAFSEYVIYVCLVAYTKQEKGGPQLPLYRVWVGFDFTQSQEQSNL